MPIKATPAAHNERDFDRDFLELAAPLLQHERIRSMEQFIQHGDTSTLLHVIAVAYYALRTARKLHLPVHERELVHGALLHDYYLYDWHIPEDAPTKWHGFTHPRHALNNAQQDFKLSPIQHDLILHHMFPLTPVPPRHREAILVCLVDKVCSTWETLGKNRYAHLRSRNWA